MEIRDVDVYESMIADCIVEMIRLAHGGGFTARQKLNGVTVLVNGDSDAKLILRDQQRAQSGYIKGDVGPYPSATLTADELACDAQVEAANEKRRADARSAYEAAAKAKQDAMEIRLCGAPAIELSDESGWQTFRANNADSYGGAVVTYAERLARLMQVEIAAGHKLEDVADRLSSEADIEGITGFMYGCAVSTLAQVWKHGEQLRRWHNLKTQIKDEGVKANEGGGVLNPAMLSIG